MTDSSEAPVELDPHVREARAMAERGWTFTPPAAQVPDPDATPPVPFGLPDLDAALGGGYRVGLHLIAGFAHHGKTQLLLTLFERNRDDLLVLFTPDEDTASVMRKLIKMATGLPLAEVYQMPKRELQDLWLQEFPFVAICDDFLGKTQMLEYLSQAEQYYGKPVRLVAFDYLGLFGSNRSGDLGAGIVSAANRAKELVKATQLPWVVIHQANRSAIKGKDDDVLTMGSLSYGGEQQATTVITVKKMMGSSLAHQQHYQAHPTIQVGVVKNKLMPHLIDYRPLKLSIDKPTGLIRAQRADEVMASPRSVMAHVSNTYGGYANSEADHGDGYGHGRSKEHYE